MPALAETLLTTLTLHGFWIFAALLLAALAALYKLGRGHRLGWPATWPKRIAALCCLLLAAISTFFLIAFQGSLGQLSDGVKRVNAHIGLEAPDLEFHRVADDAPLSLHQIAGQVTVVNLWATWCPPCIHELPALDQLQETYREQGLVVVTLSQEEQEKLRQFAVKNPYNMTNVYADEIGWLDVGNSRPMTVVIDRDGIVRDFTLGVRDFEGFEEMIRPYLKG